MMMDQVDGLVNDEMEHHQLVEVVPLFSAIMHKFMINS